LLLLLLLLLQVALVFLVGAVEMVSNPLPVPTVLVPEPPVGVLAEPGRGSDRSKDKGHGHAVFPGVERGPVLGLVEDSAIVVVVGRIVIVIVIAVVIAIAIAIVIVSHRARRGGRGLVIRQQAKDASVLQNVNAAGIVFGPGALGPATR